MSFSPAPALEARQPSGTGISCALRVSKGGRRTFTLLMTAAAMERLFGGDVAGRSAVLPSWARPSRPDGKLGQEFALKPVPRAPGQDR